jgi:putative ATP-dependent endonuclease of OLD family
MKELYNEAYVSLLIEEPEAHLHPQLQNIFFNYLNKLDKFGFQIFVTSHSPTITAKAALDSLVVLQEKEKQIVTFSLKKSNLNNLNKKYLQKFLDVTKSQLFFSNGVILVEGISEALLLPVFSKIMGNEYDIEN